MIISPDEFPQTYKELSSYIKTERDLQGISNGLYLKVTAEDCCIFLAAHIETLLALGGRDSVEDWTRSTVGAMISNQLEASDFAKKHAAYIAEIINSTKPIVTN